MNSIVERYIDRVLLYANKPEAEAETIRKEMRDHLLQKIEDLCAEGMEREEAVFQALHTHGQPSTIGYRLRGGFPWVDIRSKGTARGVIAIGPRAVGIVAFGGVAVGVVAIGGLAVGVVGIGGLALGLLIWGGLGIGGICFAGLALGAVAMGGMAIGLVAKGGLAVGAWVPPLGPHAVSHSYFTAANVPAWLRSLESVMAGPNFLATHMAIIMPLYGLLLTVMIVLQLRETKRLNGCSDDWLIDG